MIATRLVHEQIILTIPQCVMIGWTDAEMNKWSNEIRWCKDGRYDFWTNYLYNCSMCDDRLVDDQMMRWRDDPRRFVYAQMIGVITGCARIGFDLCREDKWNCVTAPHTKSKKDERGNMHMWPMADGVGAKRSMDCVKSVLEVSFVWVWNAFRYVKMFAMNL